MTSPADDIDLDTAAANAARRPTLTLDVALYEQYLDDSALPEDEKRALLTSLWAIIVGFVDLGFAVEPAPAVADKSGGGSEEFACAGFAHVDLSDASATGHFEKAAAHTVSSRD